MRRYVIGISAHFHDSACCILRDGQLIAAAQEERFNRVKNTNALPVQAFRFCLGTAGIGLDAVSAIGYYEDPQKKLERQIWMGLPDVFGGTGILGSLDGARPARDIRQFLGWPGPLWVFDHHDSHAASAYHFSGFDDAAVLTVDAVGEWTTTAYGYGYGDDLNLFERVEFPHSLGLFYSAITSFLGFDVNGDEYKVMGLAPYGRPNYVRQLEKLIESVDGGQFRLDMSYFDFMSGTEMHSPALSVLLGIPPRQPGDEITTAHMDIAQSAQHLLEIVLLEKVRYLRHAVDSSNLVMAGGVALNCVANSRILREGGYKHVFVQPAAGDAGGCLGAAVLADRALCGRPPRQRMNHVFLGPHSSCGEIHDLLSGTGLLYKHHHGSDDSLVRDIATRLAAGEVIGWSQGAMEFGPRALGARSILADPRGTGMRDKVNRLVKKRESFRPFAPVVTADAAPRYFDVAGDTRFMQFTHRVLAPSQLPAISHVDGSARVQTIDCSIMPRLYQLLRAFEAHSGYPILLNTSFNEKDEPIVCTPMDALQCFIRTNLDALVLEDIVIDQRDVPSEWRAFVNVLPQPRPPRRPNVYTLS